MSGLPAMGLSSPLSLEVTSHATKGAGQGVILLPFFIPSRAAEAGTGAVWSRGPQLGRRRMPWPPEVGWEAFFPRLMMAFGSCNKGSNTDNRDNRHDKEKTVLLGRIQEKLVADQSLLFGLHV